MEGKVMERPHTPYSKVINHVVGHESLTYEEQIQIKAIDIMVSALKQCDFEGRFGGFTTGDSARLTNRQDPNYGKDLLWGVHTPEEMFVATLVNATLDDHTDGFINDWGTKMAEISQEDPDDNSDTARAKKHIRELLEKEKQHFDVDPEEAFVHA